jgi:hypothetical protein
MQLATAAGRYFVLELVAIFQFYAFRIVGRSKTEIRAAPFLLAFCRKAPDKFHGKFGRAVDKMKSCLPRKRVQFTERTHCAITNSPDDFLE